MYFKHYDNKLRREKNMLYTGQAAAAGGDPREPAAPPLQQPGTN